jgi:hypothetical protein
MCQMRPTSLSALLLVLLLAGCEGRCPFRPDPVAPPAPPTAAVAPAPATPPPAPAVEPTPESGAVRLAPATPRVEPPPPASADMGVGAITGLAIAGLGLLAALVALYRRSR